MSQQKIVLGLLISATLLLTGCASLGRTDRTNGEQGSKGSPVVQLNEQGISNDQFRNRDRPPILTPPQDLILKNQTSGYDFDVTFVLDIPVTKMRDLMNEPSTPEAEMMERFLTWAQEKLDIFDFDCDLPPRCEATYQVGMVEGELRNEVRVPRELIELDSATITPFWVLRSARPQAPLPLGESRSWNDVPSPLGLVTSSSKLLPGLEVPLDNTGIADWGFLNPRSPRVLSGVLPEPGTTTPAPLATTPEATLQQMRTILGNTEVRPLEAAQDTDTLRAREEILGVAQKAFEALRRMEQSRTSAVQEEVKRSIAAVESSAVAAFNSKLGAKLTAKDAQEPPPCNPANAPKPPDAFTPFIVWATRITVWSTQVICEVATQSLEQIEALDPTQSRAQISADASIAQATIEAVADASQILLITETNNLINVKTEGDNAFQLIQRTVEERHSGRTALQGIMEAGLGREAAQALLTTTAGQIASSLAALGAQAEERAQVLQRDLTRTTLRQKRVRFANRTIDRNFIITLKLNKESLLEGVNPRPLAQGEPYRDEETLKLESIELAYRNDIDLTSDDGTVTLSLQVDPGSYVDLDAWLLSKAPKAIVPFEVDFFDQTDDPSYSLGYLALRDIDPQDVAAQPDNSFSTNLVVGFTGKDEPCFGDPKDCKVPLISVVQPYTGDRKSHYEASGQFDLAQTLGNRANAKLSLLYEKTDFGNVKDEKVSASQYQVNVFGTNNMILTYGKFPFAQPSSQIAISETGEGFRINYQNLSLSYLLKRESDDETSDDHDKDHDAFILFWRHPIPRNRFFRKLDLIGVHGEDRCRPVVGTRTGEGDCPTDTNTGAQLGFPHVYTTVGGELFFNIPFGKEPEDPRDRPRPLTGSLAAYYSEKDSRQSDKPDGRGRVFLLTLGRPFGFEPESSGSKKVKPVQVLTGLLGYGTGDDPDTAKDEGYLGENAVFTRDLIFLSALAGASNTSVDNVPHGIVGKGLSNKLYAGLQYTDNRVSFWELFTKLLRIRDEDIVSRSTTLSAHYFHLNEPVFDDRDAGWEFDAEFRMEQPKNVKWRMVAGYFNPGDALGGIVQKEVWTFSAGVVVEPAKLTF